MCIFIRLIRLLPYFYEFKAIRIVIATIKVMQAPFWQMISVIFTWFYLFGLWGIYLFGGKIRSDLPELLHDDSIPRLYVLFNFNDLGSAYITLFQMIIIDNWQKITNMFEIVYGSHNIRYFFIFFYFFTCVVGLNLLVAFCIEMYSLMERRE